MTDTTAENSDHEFRGRCMCSAVRFGFNGPPRFVADCVCDSCRSAHGAAVVTWVGVKEPQFSFVTDTASVAWYPSSAESERGFCTSCGTRLLFRSTKWPGEIHMAVACLDEPHVLRSSAISFASEFPRWTSVRAPE